MDIVKSQMSRAITSMPAKLPEKGLSRSRGLYVSTVVPFRMIALVSKHEESSTTTNSVPGGGKKKTYLSFHSI